MADDSGMDNRLDRDFLGRQVVLTVARAGRPHDAPKLRVQKQVPIEKCFFCPGNEHLTPPEIDRIEADGKWVIRCFPNKFSAFCRESKKAYGRHEVIVETPDHSKTLSELSEDNLLYYLQMVKKRMLDSQQDEKLKYTCVFKNEGHAAGASLEHSHTQVVGMSFVPKFVLRLQKRAAAFWKMAEKAQGKSGWYENGSFAAFCPKGSRFQNETWIAPKFRAASLSELDSAQLLQLAAALKSVLFALDASMGYPPYNIVFHSAPHGGKDFPFHVQILPRASVWAGFEYATEIVMTSALPRQSAKFLGEHLPK